MKKFFSTITTVFISATIILFGMIYSMAHPATQVGIIDVAQIPRYIEKDNDYTYYVGNETIGWSLCESDHTNGTSTTYSFTSYRALSDYLKDVFRAATDMWDSVVTFTATTNGTGKISMMINNKDGVSARCVLVSSDYGTDGDETNGHLTSWKIEINSEYADTLSRTEMASTLAHELGHAIGLNDLYEEKNYNKLMCGEGGFRTTTYPSSQDLWGARVITGQHTTHRWTGTKANHTCTMCYGIKTHTLSIANYSYTSNGASGHRVSIGCSDCNYSYTEPHGKNYSEILGRCSACGYTGATQLSVGDQTE